MRSESLDIDTIALDLTGSLETVELAHNVLGETVLAGDEHSLAAWELELGSSESGFSMLDVLGSGPNGDQWVTNFNTSGLGIWLAVGLSHTLLKSISACAREHFVDTDSVPWVGTDAHVECLSACHSLHVLVGGNTGSFKSL